MFEVGDKVVINPNTVSLHIPYISADKDVHEIIAYETIDNIRYYVLEGYERNYFEEEELLYSEFAYDLKKINKNVKHALTLRQIEALLGFDIELIEDNTSPRKRKKRKKDA